LCHAANFAAGFGDAVTFGLTDKIRDAWDANSVVDKDGGVYLAGELTGAATTAALGTATASAIREGSTLATSSPVRAVATKILSSKPAQALFGKGGTLNSGQDFRVGVSRAEDGGRFVLRAAGRFVEKAAGTNKIDLIDLGKIADFVSALGK
jgi:hypothetical protein